MKRQTTTLPTLTLMLLIASVAVAQTPAGSSQAGARTLLFDLDVLEFSPELAKGLERAAQDRARLDKLIADGKVRPVGEIQVRTRSGEAASFRASQRIPIQLASTGQAPGQTPQVQYDNTALSLDLTPELLADGRVLANVKLDLNTIARGASTNPYFSQRSFVSKVR